MTSYANPNRSEILTLSRDVPIGQHANRPIGTTLAYRLARSW